MAKLWNPRRHGSHKDWDRWGWGITLCANCGYQGANGSRLPSWWGRQPGVAYSPTNHILCKVGVFREQPWRSRAYSIFSLQPPTIVDNRWYIEVFHYGTLNGLREGKEFFLDSSLYFKSLINLEKYKPARLQIRGCCQYYLNIISLSAKWRPCTYS